MWWEAGVGCVVEEGVTPPYDNIVDVLPYCAATTVRDHRGHKNDNNY